ncbi:MAG: phosphatase PAP2 family protein [Kiritimatiellaeota bacterium]|nr:phosphatase PAP2 family protein [Kiritimatiellota bacterium]
MISIKQPLRVLCCLLPVLLTGPRAAADGIETTGDILQYALPATAAGVTALHRDWDGTLELAGALMLQGGIVFVLKNSVHETRPNGNGSESFPSGHAAVTFASAEFLRGHYGWTYGGPAYALAAFTAYSRVESDHHYWGDVAAGAGIGIFSSWLLNGKFKGWDIHPSTDGHSFSLKFSRPW